MRALIFFRRHNTDLRHQPPSTEKDRMHNTPHSSRNTKYHSALQLNTAKHVCLTIALLTLSACMTTPMPTTVAAKLGDVIAEPALVLMEAEITKGLEARQLNEKFKGYQAWAVRGLNNTAGARCRLGYCDRMLRNMLKAPADAEKLTRQLHQALGGSEFDLAGALKMAAEKLDTTPAIAAEYRVRSGKTAIAAVQACLAATSKEWQTAIGPLSADQVTLLRTDLYRLSTEAITGGAASWPEHPTSRRMCEAMTQMNRPALLAAATELAPLTDPRMKTALAKIKRTGNPKIDGATGKLLRLIETENGKILIGGPGENTYDLDKLVDVAVVIDVAGNDTYVEGVVNATRPVLVVMDLAGDDSYKGSKPGIQGSALLGVSMLVDFAGDDKYDASDVAQGTCLAGVGILVDWAGTDAYSAMRRAQGSATGGVGILVDRAGDDTYHASLYAQGFGGPLGFGLIEDTAGNDHYYAGGVNPDSYGDTPGYAGWSQGAGAGPRGIANGGIGIMLDGDGDDVYECDYFSHGAGYWFTVGLARDFGGNDQRLGSTINGFDGGERGESRFLRYGIGFGVHYGIGLVFDDAGNDTYAADHAGPAFGYDISLGGIFDFGGNDTFGQTGIGQGAAAANGFAILFSVGGDDDYQGSGQANAGDGSPGNFGFLIDYQGNDKYGDEEQSDVYLERASTAGFLIDRSEIPKTE